MGQESQRVLECGRLRLRFVWQGDRFAHEVSLVDSRQATDMLCSVEGAASEAWPASPPLQSLHVEEHAGMQVALLVGMAGKCHWSAAVELIAEHSRLRWDVACRVRGSEIQWLGSSYQSDAKIQLVESGVALVGERGAGGELALRWEGEGASTAALTIKDQRLQINAGGSIDRAGAETIRWKYAIEPCA